MPDFGENYYRMKRTALVLLSLVTVLCLPGVTSQRFSFGGIEVEGVAFDLLIGMLFVAAVYYCVNFAFVWWIEARANLLSIERGEEGLRASIQSGMQEAHALQAELQPFLTSAIRHFNDSNGVNYMRNLGTLVGRQSEADQLTKLLDERINKVLPKRPEYLYNLVSSMFQDVQRRVPPSRQLDLMSFHGDVVKAATADASAVVAQAAGTVAKEHFERRAALLEEFTNEMRATRKATLGAWDSQDARLQSFELALRRLDLKLDALKTARRLKFAILDTGGVATLILLALVLFVVRFVG